MHRRPTFHSTAWMTMPPEVVAPGNLFVVGDVHGNAHLLDPVLEWVASEATGSGEDELVFLGDLIDRGHECFRTIELAMLGVAGMRRTILPGNHEIAMLKFLAGRRGAFDIWMNKGGASMVQEIHDMDGMTTHAEIRQLVRDALPNGFEEEMMTGPTHLRRGSLLMLHAGVDPAAPDPDAYLATARFDGDPITHWSMITDSFSDWQGGWDVFGAAAIVHGHQPIADPIWSEAVRKSHEGLFTHGRLALDFGSGFLDRLGGAQMSGNRIRYFGVA